MNQPFYNFSILEKTCQFKFFSTGKVVIPKIVIFLETDTPNLFTLTLADIHGDGSYDFTSVSDNGDIEKILTTVFQTIVVFLNHYPESVITFEGSSSARTRLYRIAISHELTELTKLYNIWGLFGTTLEPFRKNRTYEAFFISLKSISIA